jgi:ABC-2 type transport system ATP-binding protein
MMNNGTIVFESVTKIYRIGFFARKAVGVQDLSFSVGHDTVTGFVGPNGAGKTTTIKLLLGLSRPDRGTITIQGMRAAEPASRARVAYLSEQPHFYEHLSAAETLELACRILRLKPPLRREIGRVLDEVELEETAHKRVKDLSKGMQQRLGMAMALLGDPDIFILDEPMSGLDPLGRRLFRAILKRLGDRGKCVLFSTHSLEDVAMLCTDILVLSRGTLVYQGAVASLLKQGYEGTEVTVEGLTDAQKQALQTMGYRIVDSRDNLCTLFVAAGQDPKKCQRWLFENSIGIDSIVPRSRSLEAILYSPGGAREKP